MLNIAHEILDPICTKAWKAAVLDTYYACDDETANMTRWIKMASDLVGAVRVAIRSKAFGPLMSITCLADSHLREVETDWLAAVEDDVEGEF